MNSEFTMILFCVLLECVYSHSVVSNSLWPHGLYCARLLCPWNSPGENTGVGCSSLLQGMFPTQGMNLSLLLCRQILYHLSHQESPYVWLLAYYLYLCKIFFLVIVLSFTAFSPNGYRRIYFFNRLHATVNLKKMHNVRVVSQVSFGGKMRTAAWETAPQITLRTCSKEAGGEGQYICDFGEREIYMQSNRFFFLEGFC